MTLYHNEQTRSYIDSEDYSEYSVYIKQFLDSIVNSDKYVVSAMLNLDGIKYVSGNNYLNLEDFLSEYEDFVTSQKGKVVWIPTQNLSTRYKQSVKNFVLARAVNSPVRNVGVLWLFLREEFFDDVLENKSLNTSLDTLIVSPDCFWYNENRAFRNLKNPA